MKLPANIAWLNSALIIAMILASTHSRGETEAVFKTVRISGDRIRLSDLLVPEVSSETRHAAEQIDLGRAPQCDSLRILDPWEIAESASSQPLLRGIAFRDPVSVSRSCFPIRREAIQQAIVEFLRQKAPDLPVPSLMKSQVIYASAENPSLQVVEAAPDPVRPTLQIRLRCVDRTLCPAFWVFLPLDRQPRLFALAKIAGHTAAKAVAAGQPYLVNSGERVLLIFDDPPIRMQLQALCMEHGRIGSQVRAIDPSTHHMFHAEVIGPGTLRALL